MNRYHLILISLLPTVLLISCAKGDGSSSAGSYTRCEVSSDSLADYESYGEDLQSSQDNLDLFSEKTDRWIVTLDQPMLEPSGKTLKKYKLVKKSFSISSISAKVLSVEISEAANRNKVLEEINNNYPVKYVEPDHKLYALDINTNFNIDKQWGHHNIQSEAAWSLTQGNSEVVIAVIDSGVDFGHPDLIHSRWNNPFEVINGKDDDGNGYIDDIHGWNYVNKNSKPYPHKNVRNDYHGTHVAGIIAGLKKSTYSGVAPKVKLMSLRFLDDNKSGYTSYAIEAIRYATDKGAKIINASFGSYKSSKAMLDAIKYAQAKGVLIIAAAGNLGQDNDSRPFYPASYPATNIVSVTASTSRDSWLSGINYGQQSVDIAAPGDKIFSTDQNNSYRSRSGSSMAAPFVSGVAGLLLSINVNLSGEQIKTLLLNNAESFSSLQHRVKGGRRLNAGKSTSAGFKSATGGYVPPSCNL